VLFATIPLQAQQWPYAGYGGGNMGYYGLSNGYANNYNGLYNGIVIFTGYPENMQICF
jgi:hypothetical protein